MKQARSPSNGDPLMVMRRKRKSEEHDSQDRWVISYADFITLLFALFTTLFAISNVDKGKLQRFAGSMKTAFKSSSTDAIDTSIIAGIRIENYADENLEKDIREEFRKFNVIEGLLIARNERGVVLSFGDTLLFESGSAELRKAMRPTFNAVAVMINKSQRSVIIEGHTDNIPLRNARYVSNIELSAARAAAVFAFFIAEYPVSPDQLATAGYGEYRPVASNSTPEGRTRNRRIDFIFTSAKDKL